MNDLQKTCRYCAKWMAKSRLTSIQGFCTALVIHSYGETHLLEQKWVRPGSPIFTRSDFGCSEFEAK